MGSTRHIMQYRANPIWASAITGSWNFPAQENGASRNFFVLIEIFIHYASPRWTTTPQISEIFSNIFF
jgi:hypothetical protein